MVGWAARPPTLSYDRRRRAAAAPNRRTGFAEDRPVGRAAICELEDFFTPLEVAIEVFLLHPVGG